jgi:hypothetical protein
MRRHNTISSAYIFHMSALIICILHRCCRNCVVMSYALYCNGGICCTYTVQGLGNCVGVIV